ncbi:MAG: chromosome segregation protein SMC, partial [Chitinispirillaceae bacterium]|nr:chromosome segregation protein SMC [Chitinispirillaceae bacterium]
GEQKVTLLRSATMQDVIFSGTQARQPLNMAEVVLTIENNKGILPVEYSEVAISRRMFRNGESEYSINRVPCRLRDIHNLFLDTGVGSSAYTTIERGMIDSILSDKAEERRVLFEEAAGIGKYKQRRKESLRQLEKTGQDLLRINDKVQEADRQVHMLARHVEKARRFKTYKEDLRAIELGYWNRTFSALGETIRQRKQKLDETANARDVVKGRISAGEAQIENMRIAALEKEKGLEAASRSVGETGEKIIMLERDLSVAAERMKNLAANIGAAERDIGAIEAHIEENSSFKTQIEKCIIERESEMRGLAERRTAVEGELAQFDGTFQVCRENADRLSREQIDLITSLGGLKNTESALKAGLTGGFERRERTRGEMQSIERRTAECREAIAASQKQLLEADEENSNLLRSREALLERIDKEDNFYQELVEREKRLEAQIDASDAQLRFLEGLDASFEGYESGIRTLLTRMPQGFLGSVANLIRVTDEQAVDLVERVLGLAVQTAVFDTEEHLRTAARQLNGENAGTARMIALDRIIDMRGVPVPESASGAGAMEEMRSMVKTADGCEALSAYLLEGVFVADCGDRAMSLAKQCGPSYTFIGRDGIICKGDGTVIAGDAKKGQTKGLLSRKLEIVQFSGVIERCRKEHAATLHDKDTCIINRDEAKKALVEVDEKLNRSQRLSQEQQMTIKHYEAELQNCGEKAQFLYREDGEIGALIAALETDIARNGVDAGTQQKQYDALESRLEEARRRLREMEDERRRLVEGQKNCELEEQGLGSRLAQDRHDVERLTKENDKSSERKRQKLEEKQKAEAEASLLAGTVERIRGEQMALVLERKRREEVRDAVREEYNGCLAAVDDARKILKTEQNRFEELCGLLHTVELEQARDEQEQRSIRERMWEAYEVDLSSSAGPFKEVNEDDAAVMEHMEMLRERIRRVGDVNMAAFEEYETESARLKELTIQRDDLQKAVGDLERAVKKLDKEARAQFLTTFEQVQNYFGSMFTTLFEGGEAHLQLDENVDPLEATIHINVRPAGKKMRSVQMLSAGERALTAISLLFALYLVKPSAYCILDELDAPLDEANTVRFLKVVRKFSGNTQFIVITHNKRTMEAADVLYGVTQRESGVSTIISVKFEEAARQAA